MDALRIRPFASEDQDAARRLIIAGLAEHFGFINERINTDLEDIAARYGGETFLVAERDGEVVGTER